jgi:Tol biopolymer transport system component
MRGQHIPLGSLVAGAILVAGAATPALAQGTTTRVSVSSAEAQGNGASVGPHISGDGRFVGFTSFATNLVPGDTNGVNDLFLRDRQKGTTIRVSVGQNGEQQNAGSLGSALARNGRFFAFVSPATNLVPGDTNAQSDVFVRDVRAGTTRRVNVSTDGAQANDGGGFPAISADGRFVVFLSDSTNLVPGDTNGENDVFVHDRRTRTTTRVSMGPDGIQGNGNSIPDVGSPFPTISGNGRFVAFTSLASNLVPGDTNDAADVFVRDRRRETTRRVSVRSNGAQAKGGSFNPSISGDGRLVAFTSNASNLVKGDRNDVIDVFVRDLRTGTTRRVSVGPLGREANDGSFSTQKAISADGRFVTFISSASNLVPDDTNGVSDVFVHDLHTGRTSLVSVGADDEQGNEASGGLLTGISSDGRFVAFFSLASNLVPGDTNEAGDVFVRDRGAPQASTDRETLAHAQ